MLQVKLYPPKPTTNLITRPNLIARLNKNIDKPLTLVSAPAGYGKSVIISQWLELNGQKFIWLSLDEELNDFHTFLQCLVEAIHVIAPGKFQNIQRMLSSSAMLSAKTVFETIVNGLDEFEENIVIVFDDYHCIRNQEIHDFVNAYLKYPPENIHLVIITRRDPPLIISQMRLYDRVHEIRTIQLAFSEKEIRELVQITTHQEVSKEYLSLLKSRTEGWVLGLKMFLHAIENEELPLHSDISYSQNLDDFIEYIETGSLLQFTQDFKTVLQHVSLLDRFNAEVIDHLISSANLTTAFTGKTFISEICNKNLFVIAQDADGEWYRFHHLFQEVMFQVFIKKTKRHHVNKLYHAISDWFKANESGFIAIKYAVKGQDYNRAIVVLVEQLTHRINAEEWWVIQQWMSQLPGKFIAENPALLSAKLFVLEESYQIGKIPNVLKALENKVQENVTDPNYPEFLFHKGFTELWIHSNPEAALDCLKRAKLHFKNDGVIKRRIIFYMSVAFQMVNCEGEIYKVLEGYKQSNLNPNYAYHDYVMIIVNLLSGNFKDSIRIANKMGNTMHEPSNNMIAWVKYLHGNAMLQQLELTECIEKFEEAREINPFFQYRLSVDAVVGKVLSYYLINDKKEQKLYLSKMIKFTAEINFLKIARSCEARINLLLGDFDAASRWAKNCHDDFHIREFQFFLEVPLLTKARIQLLSEDPDEIHAGLDDVMVYFEKSLTINNRYHSADLLVLQTIGLFKLNRIKEAESSLQQALEVGDDQNLLRPFVEPGVIMKTILHELSSAVGHAAFVKRICYFIDQRFIKDRNTQSEESLLSSREIEVIQVASKGLRNKEIADELNISVETVKSHLKNSFRKLPAKNRIELIHKAAGMNLIRLE